MNLFYSQIIHLKKMYVEEYFFFLNRADFKKLRRSLFYLEEYCRGLFSLNNFCERPYFILKPFVMTFVFKNCEGIYKFIVAVICIQNIIMIM